MVSEIKKIIASGPVIVYKGRLLVSHDGKDDFYKIPGGKLVEGESLEECAIRELKEETGLDGKIKNQLSTKYLSKKPGTEEEVKISLYHFKSELEKAPETFESFDYNKHKVYWLKIEDIKEGKYKVAPNIEFLIEKGEIK
ncbi:MAG: MutT/NUDIX [archaeon GW2011_AR13]|nr:MAG: MutT/NUDIX [archaeon GW2011_AR13]HIG94617.1 NUDIX hydrolase [Nanoarchaeota archaeon]HIH63356.1 NUDIX hydrolase [Nanoarchaeota archaeon]HIJ09980.1 NUDIX hydrolase [Nanoarchaeota archaeon]